MNSPSCPDEKQSKHTCVFFHGIELKIYDSHLEELIHFYHTLHEDHN